MKSGSRGFLLAGLLALCGCSQPEQKENIQNPIPIETQESSHATRYHTVGHRILEIEAECGQPEDCYRVLDDLIERSDAEIKIAEKRLADPSVTTGSDPLNEVVDSFRERIAETNKRIEKYTADLQMLEGNKAAESIYRLIGKWLDEDTQELGSIRNEVAAKIFFRSVEAVLREDYKDAERGRDVVLLTEAIKTKTLDCDTESDIDVSIAQALGLSKYPVRFVLGLEHAFVRWDPDNNHNPLNKQSSENKGDFNWDPVNHIELEDEYYIILPWGTFGQHLDPEKLAGTCYLKSISPDQQEALALAYFNVGRTYDQMRTPYPSTDLKPEEFQTQLQKWEAAEHDREEKALSFYSKTIDLMPNWNVPYSSRGLIWLLRGDKEKGETDFARSRELLPF